MSSINNEVKYTVSLKDLMSSGLDKIKGKTDQLDKSVERTKNSIGNLNSIAGSIGLGLSIGGIASFGRSVVDSLKNYEYFSASLRTLMLGDAQAKPAFEEFLSQWLRLDVVLLATRDRRRFREFNSETAAAMAGYAGDGGLRTFLEQEGAALKALITGRRDEFADEVWASMRAAWDITDA